jgi:hypothetical protein
MKTQQLDPIEYLRFPKLDVMKALSLARILVRRAPQSPSGPVRRALALVESSLDELNAKWKEQTVPLVAKRDARPLTRRLGSAWSAIRDRLLSYEAEPEDSADRMRAASIHEMLFPEGLEFTLVAFASQHAESQYRIEIIDERGLAEDLGRLVGGNFLATLRAAHQALGDALGISKTVLPSVPVVLTEPLRALGEAISRYALQLLAIASDNPDKRDEVLVALSPIDEFRAQTGRRITSQDDDEEDVEDEDEDEDTDVDDIAHAPIATPVPVTPAPVVLAPVA